MAGVKSPAVKRSLADVRELRAHPSPRYEAHPLEENVLEWHFTLRGPRGTDFEGGLYHGRIILPPSYPYKPPNIVFLTPNGRFRVGQKICLSISAYHPEMWQPAWGVRTILEALISFLPTEGEGAIGSLDWTPQERKRLALESQQFECELCGRIADRIEDEPEEEGEGEGAQRREQCMDAGAQELLKQLHVHAVASPSPNAPAGRSPPASTTASAAASAAAAPQPLPPPALDMSAQHTTSTPTTTTATDSDSQGTREAAIHAQRPSAAEQTRPPPLQVQQQGAHVRARPLYEQGQGHGQGHTQGDVAAAAEAAAAAIAGADDPHLQATAAALRTTNEERRRKDAVDQLLGYILSALVIAILAVLMRKLFRDDGPTEFGPAPSPEPLPMSVAPK